jgi:hypothetical protein
MFNLPLDIKQQTIKLSGKLINGDENNFRLVGWLVGWLMWLVNGIQHHF